MKRILLTLFILIMSVCSYSQIVNDTIIKKFPRYYVENGVTIGVIFSLEQAQRLDNNLTLLDLYKTKSMGCDELEKSYKQVLNDMVDQANLSNFKIKKLTEINVNQNTMISNLNSQIISFQNDSALAKRQQSDLMQINKNLNKQINKQKFQKIAGFSVAGVSIAGILALSFKLIR